MITSGSGTAVGVLLLAAMITADDSNTLSTDLHQLAVPTIRPSETEIILDSGQNYTLYCSGTRGIQFKRQELSEEITSNFSTKERIIKDDESGYEVALDLVNVDRFAVGYYACFDGSVNASEVLTNVIEEPQNTPHISYTYIYVNGTTLHAPLKTFVVTKGNTTFLIECRPTAPDIKVELLPQSNKKPFYEKFSSKIGFIFARAPKSAGYHCNMTRDTENYSIHISNSRKPPPEPHISLDSLYFLDGETFSINCTVEKISNQAVDLRWETPRKVYTKTNDKSMDKILYKNITVVNASKDDAGNYTCISSNAYSTIDLTVQKVFLEKPKLETIIKNRNSLIQQNITKMVRAGVEINDYPPADIVFLKNGERISGNITSCHVQERTEKNVKYYEKTKCTIRLQTLKLEDMGNYTVRATNKYLTNSSTYDIRVTAHPTVDFEDDTNKTFLLNTQASLFCKAKGYPMPNVIWTFYPEQGEPEIIKNHQNDTSTSLYSKESILTIPVRTAGFISCRASNINEISKEIKKRFIVYEILNGFGIKNNKTWFPEKQYVELKCLGSIFEFNNLTWYGPDGSVMDNVEYTNNTLSYVAKLKMEHISINQRGNYTCIGIRQNGSEENDTINIAVEGTQDPSIVDANGEGKDEVEVIQYQPVIFTCAANAVPPPTIEWYKDGTLVENSTDVQIFINNPEHSYRNSTLIIPAIHEEHAGKYECRATSHGKLDSRIYNLFLKENTHTKTYVSIIGAILLLMLGLIAILAWRIRKLKAFKRELAAAGLLNFKEGAAASLNPEIGIDEQAELLPYDEKFEFPAECLKLGKQLGAGAFGVVYKAEARGILDAEKTTTVAVKMVKKTADNMYIKALASELKIMVHLGKHVNIVNLLGACTKNVGKRELIVIVEYCKFGNIHNYMQKHREVFIDQFNDNPDKLMGKVNRGYSSSSGNSGMNSDYFGSNHTQSTYHTLLNTANTNRSSRKQSDTGYVQPEWRSNYESDYSFDGRSPRPLYTRDLIAWAFQIARGMEYLASRKVLHGDLAARNVLLADDNIVKICDFGLARSIYKNDEYQKQENSPLPVKWLAIECMTDRIFSTQSDVWSFGVVLWELFSLAKTPYPNVSLPGLLQWLREGGRLEKPPYSDDRIYAVMRNCWEEKPTRRPTFTELQTTLGSFLEDNVRNHYVDLDAAYMDMNTKKAGEDDYLAMVNAPDYNNLITPSPHHYVNDGQQHFSYPPTVNQLREDEGYLPMSPATGQNLFNARVQGTKFDFDARKLTPRVSESSYGESTPMLDLNNLPRSGSESDQEGHSPAFHGNVCPRIEEEADEVFIENSKNTQPNSITNPTYITMSPGIEKKSHNFENNYINVKIPNGLVK